MQEIKFRQRIKAIGKQTDDRWHFWGFGIDTGLGIDKDEFVPPISSVEWDERKSYQYTGLHDCKGKEIFERDIVRTKYGKQGSQQLLVRELNEYGVIFERIAGMGIYFYFNLPQRETMEIISSEFENPELLANAQSQA